MATAVQDPPAAEAKPAESQTAEAVESSESKTTEKEQSEKTHAQHRERQSNRGGSNRGRGSQRRHNNRSNYESLPESNDADDIRRQVDFYFSESNLPLDAYLLKLTGGAKNEPVPLKTIHSFRRMRHYQPYSAVRAAVQDSELINLDDGDMITRKTPLDSRFTLDADANKKIAHEISMPRSIYAKGFGYEHPTSQLDIETYFEPYGPINSVRLRRHPDGAFKGSVFVEFADEKLAEQFLGLESHPSFIQHGKKKDDSKEEANGKPTEYKLNIMGKKAYLDSKGIEAEDESGAQSGNNRHQNYKHQRGNKSGRGRGRGRDQGRPRDRDHKPSAKSNIDKDDWNRRRELDQADEAKSVDADAKNGANTEPAAANESKTAGEDNSKKRNRDDEETEPPAKKAKADGDAE